MFGGTFNILHWAIALPILFFVAKWLLTGITRLFRRYNTLLVILYLVLLTPLALAHAFFLGVFGASEDELREQKIKEEAEFQLAVEKEKARRS
jgi:hypothetical protein